MNKKEPNLIALLYETEAARMRGLACKRVTDPHEADDLVNEAFRILSERSRAEEIGNPRAYLFSVLDRQINSHLRKRYRRRLVSLDRAEDHQLPSTPDVADWVQKMEEQALVKDAVRAISSKRQRRVLHLTGLNLKPGEIARLETAAGRPATSHQITCVLRRSLVNLRMQFRRRGLVPSVIPGLWAGRSGRRLVDLSTAGMNLPKMAYGGVALQVAIMASLTGLFVPRPSSPSWAGNRTAPGAGGPPSSPAAFVLSDLRIQEPPQEMSAEQAPGMAAAQPRPAYPAPPGSPHASAPAGTSPPELSAPQTAGQPVAPRAEISQSEDRFSASVEPVPGEESSIATWQEEADEAAPAVTDQALKMAEDPNRIPKPECGGLPVCSGGAPPPNADGGRMP